MNRQPRRSLTLAFVVSVLLIVLLPRAAVAAPAPPSASASASSTVGAGVCTLTGVVRTDGARCPGNHRLQRQILGIPSPQRLLNPVNVIGKVTGGVATNAFGAVALAVLGGWVASGAESALKDTAKVIGASTKPELTSSWFSASYWKIAAIAALLTLPFLCAAAIHALVRSDLGLLTRAAFGYLPLSLLAVGIASQLTMLLLSATDEMSSIVSTASANADGLFLAHAGVDAIASSLGSGNPFVAFLAAIITVAAALTLWVELLVRDAAVYVIVLMLPLFFAAMVWPARRALAIRAIETLIALILSKFAIVAVLALGGAALGHSTIGGPAAMLTGATLVLLAAFSPWALLRILPLHEVASAAAGGLSPGLKEGARATVGSADGFASRAIALGADGAGWLRPRLASGAQSLLDGSRYRDAHRSPALSEPGSGGDPIQSAHLDGDIEPVAPGSPGGAGGAHGGGVSPARDQDAAPGDWSWPRRSSDAPGTGDGDAAAVAGEPDAGHPVPAGDGPDGPDGTDGAGRASARRGPDGVTFPYALGPDDPPLVLDRAALAELAEANAASGRLGPAAQRAEANAAFGPAGPAADGLQTPSKEPIIEPPPFAHDDPLGRPPPAPGRDATGSLAPPAEPIGPSAPPPPIRDPGPPTDAGDEGGG